MPHTQNGLINVQPSRGRTHFANVCAWIDVSTLPEKINGFQHGVEREWCRPQCPENIYHFFNDCATNELSMRSCSWNVADSNQPFGNFIKWDEVLDMTAQKTYSMILCGRKVHIFMHQIHITSVEMFFFKPNACETRKKTFQLQCFSHAGALYSRALCPIKVVADQVINYSCYDSTVSESYGHNYLGFIGKLG